ncbi:tetratricopeptide repeat protein [Kordia sp.]|uniref:tetratricopeptide repeat protein n=1 Tax=Kordia sp. TaxID=1965332 RepID=UPI003D2DC1DC
MASKLTEALLAEMHQYLNGTMNELERTRFEQKLANDEELKRELVLEKELRTVLNEDSEYNPLAIEQKSEELTKLKAKLRSDEYQQLSNTIKSVGASYLKEETAKKPRKSYHKYFMVAAVVVLFFGIYFSLLTTSLDSYYEANVNWSELQSFVEKGQQKDLFSQGETAFRASNYEEAIAKFTQIESTNKYYVYSLQYLGASYDKLNENEKAIATFRKLLKSGNSLENSKGLWYETLIHLKMKNKEKAIESLKNLIKNSTNYKYKEAVELLDDLE